MGSHRYLPVLRAKTKGVLLLPFSEILGRTRVLLGLGVDGKVLRVSTESGRRPRRQTFTCRGVRVMVEAHILWLMAEGVVNLTTFSKADK